MKYLIPILALSLAACGGKPEARPEPIIVPQTVVVPVAGGCVPRTLTPPPEYVDSDQALAAAVDAAVRYQLLWAGREQKTARLNEIEPIIAGCPKGSSD